MPVHECQATHSIGGLVYGPPSHPPSWRIGTIADSRWVRELKGELLQRISASHCAPPPFFGQQNSQCQSRRIQSRHAAAVQRIVLTLSRSSTVPTRCEADWELGNEAAASLILA